MPARSTPALRLTLASTLLLSAACGPGTNTTDDTSTTATSTAAGTTTDVPTGTGDTSDTQTGSATATGTATTTGDDATGTTTAPTTTATEGSTGAVDCPFAGSTDCAVLVAASDELTMEECMACQGTACGQNADCDANYPCVDGNIVLQGCCTDEQCAGLTPFCGMFIGTNNICVLNDDV